MNAPHEPIHLLAIKVVNLRRALEVANDCLAKHQQLLVGCSEDERPTFHEASHFYAEVRKVKASVAR